MGRVEEQLISLETATLASDKGFTSRSKWYYSRKSGILKQIGNDNSGFIGGTVSNPDFSICEAPTQSLLQKWLRDVHGIDIWIEPAWEDHSYSKVKYIGYYCGRDPWSEEDEITEDDYLDTYEEALEATLKQALSLI